MKVADINSDGVPTITGAGGLGGTSGSLTDPMTTRGDIIVRDSTNTTARKAVGAANTYLGSDGTDPSWSQVTDAKLSTSDITTNNVSTSKHGFAPKGDGNAAHYLDGTGAYSTPAGGGGSSLDTGRASLFTYGSLISATYGDHFDAGSLDAKWNAYYGARGNWNTTDMSGWAHDASNTGALIQAVPAGNWTIECEVIPGTLASTGFQDEGLIVTSGSSQGSSTDMRWGCGQANSLTSYRLVWEKFVNGAFSSSYTTNLNALTIPLFAPIYLRLVWGGTNFTAQWSYNRRAWYDVAAAAAPGFTVANFGINNNSAGGWFNYFDKVA